MTSKQATHSGRLYIVATPIGHIDDISKRAIDTLSKVDLILAEDTRHSKKLLRALNINQPLASFHTHNENTHVKKVIQQLQNGLHIALISDAGTPLISDPGYPLVHQARSNHIEVIPIPGACAAITALSASGLPCDTFTYVGFLPAKSSSRLTQLNALLPLGHTLVIYESKHRLVKTIKEIEQVFGSEHNIVLAKELTKINEGFIQGNCQTILAWLSEDPKRLNGEFVLLISRKHQTIDKRNEHQVLSILLSELPLKQAVDLASQILEIPKNALYKQALELKS